MESNLTAIMLLRWKPLIEEFKQWVMEARKAGVSDAHMEAILSYIETTAAHEAGPSVLEVMMHELREAARSTHPGSASTQ
jgi:N-glycosylase/DNA lyase